MAQVLPSGDDFATAAVPMLPPPPARFSTMTVVRSLCCISGWIKRAIMSVDPPGGYGTTINIACRPVLGMSRQWGDQRTKKQGAPGKHAHQYPPRKICVYAAIWTRTGICCGQA